MLRGYRLLKSTNNLCLIGDLQQALREKSLGFVASDFSETIMGDAIGSADLIIRQRVSKVRDVLTKALLVASSKPNGVTICPLPRQWRQGVQKAGFKVAHLRCEVLWYLYVAAQMALGFVQIASTIGKSIWHVVPTHAFPQEYVYFCNLRQGNLLRPTKDNLGYCIINWYCQWNAHGKAVQAIHHSVKGSEDSEVNGIAVRYQSTVLPNLEGMGPNLAYCLWAIKATSISMVDLLRGRWWHALLLREASPAKIVKLINPKRLARQYLFHNGVYFPPLWTYAARHSGSEILMYFYSTNSESMQMYKGHVPTANMYSLMNWPHYLVWDSYQSDAVRQYEGQDSKIEIVGPIWFEDNGLLMPEVGGKKIAVFDVQPFRKSFYCSMGLAFEYYVPEVACDFLGDTSKAVIASDATMLYKAKREVGSLVHPVFEGCRNNVIESSSVCNLDPGISAYRVIQAADAVVSMPFTSTALLAREIGKPTAYYDPSGILQPNDPAAHGILVIQDYKKLVEWFQSILDGDATSLQPETKTL